MAEFPVSGVDTNWGEKLKNWCLVAHNADGTIKNRVAINFTVYANVVNNQPVPSTWTSIDLSAIGLTSSDRALLLVGVDAVGGSCDITFRPADDNINIGYYDVGYSLFGGGITAATITTGNRAYLLLDHRGGIQVKKTGIGTNYSLHVFAIIRVYE